MTAPAHIPQILRGLVSPVFANLLPPDEENPNAALSELAAAVRDFQKKQADRTAALEAEIDSLNGQLAAHRLNGGGGRDAQASRRAVSAFGDFAKTGSPEAMAALMPQAAMSTDDSSKGGFLVPAEVASTIIGRQLDFSPMRRLATVVQSSSDSYEQLVNAGGSTASWVGERESRPETSSPGLIRVAVTAHEIYANPSVTQTLLDDARFDVGDFVSTSIAEEFSLKEGAAFVSGDGVKKPRGFLSYETPVTTDDATRPFGTLQYVPSGVAAALSDATHNGIDALSDLIYKLKAGYRTNARWLMNSATAATIRKLKSKTEELYLWQPPVQAGQPPALLGYPVEFDENMPDIGAGNFPIAFGDFRRGYLIVDRTNVRVLRDPFTNKPFVMFYTTKRVGGGLLHSSAIKLLKIAAT